MRDQRISYASSSTQPCAIIGRPASDSSATIALDSGQPCATTAREATATNRQPCATSAQAIARLRSRTPQNPAQVLNTLSSVSVRESRIQYLCDPQWFRDTASRGPTTIVAPESQFRICPSDHDSIGYPRMSASGESLTTMHRLLHASGSHPIPPPNDPKCDDSADHHRVVVFRRDDSVSHHNSNVGPFRHDYSAGRSQRAKEYSSQGNQAQYVCVNA
ncbi:hypothetical protein F511_18870 [Dorcoceras hygrometricum]|uniref:Uncharacterized protein n=1 Tax=Dorcoceras hygrometricum TaxID=472368 RepID=A0A2Z7CB99_9LAMI|nr:hypothetical protein F511_18870 [Dorcoceras hygrometricum]